MSQTSPESETVGCGTPGCADPNCTYGRDDDWPPVKMALWRVLMDEKLNDGHYIKAFDLIEKLHAAVLSSGHAQTPAEPHEATYLRGWNEGVERSAEVAESYPSSGEQTEHPVEYWIRRLSDTSTDGESTPRVPKVRTSHHRNNEEAARLQKLVDDRFAPSVSSPDREGK